MAAGNAREPGRLRRAVDPRARAAQVSRPVRLAALATVVTGVPALAAGPYVGLLVASVGALAINVLLLREHLDKRRSGGKRRA